MKPIAIFTCLCTLLFLLSNCSKNSGKLSESERQALRMELTQLADSVEAAKAKAFASEAIKANATAELISELESVGARMNTAELAKVRKSRQQMINLRYNEESLASEEHMLAYDAACDSLLLDLNKLTNDIPEFERFTRARILYDEVIEANRQDLFLRRDYNNHARALNGVLRGQQAALSSLGGQYAEMETLPLFYGEPVQ